MMKWSCLADLAGVDPPVARHAEVKDERLAAVGVDQTVFRAAAKAGHPRADQSLAKVLRKRPAEIGPPCLDALDAAALEDALETADGRLDFGKLGHELVIARNEVTKQSSRLDLWIASLRSQ